jgi:F0F1-type ATP synthase epsilon subunit
MTDNLKVKINSPENIIWQGEAKWVSSINTNGPFDILPFHANFITVVENKTIKINTGEKIEEYKYPRAVIYTHKNQVWIYVNI